jgi:UDP-N-acetylglucosamine diphosphorylase / glucose-1-phosphate thymidylyltransferase / UDP-N-acetylgalactosamine diphosphorylase / glucosamine-1-phosphate N-acetyltransferase / galactosamine-1-phosphate N-acetyltransferase
MQAVILAAGRGVRMMPLTETLPKPLLKIDDKSILDYTLRRLPPQIDEVLLVVGYLKEKIISYVQESYPQLKVRFVDCPPKGTAYAVSVCKDLVQGNFLVLNGDDLYSTSDLESLCRQGRPALLALRQDKPSAEFSRFGRLVPDDEQNLKGITIDGALSPWVNIGAYLLDQEYFQAPMVKLDKSDEYGLPQTLMGMAQKGSKIGIVEARDWFPIGYPEDLAKAKEHVHDRGN